MTLRIFFFLLVLLVSVNTSFAQEPAPSPSPTPVKKANQRPNAGTPAEPFDNADVKTMATKCVKLETESGNVELEFFPESAPETVRNFLNLVAKKFYDTTLFSRVVPNFVVQGGSFFTRLQKPQELHERSKRKVIDEPSLIKHERGIVSMARGDEPNSASTHFFILVGEGKHLDGKFAAFGRVTNGIEIVDLINQMPVEGEKPAKPVRLLKAAIIGCPAKTEN
ncbi:MAG: peptidylprolyl isomerase [Acidobacteriota bacterium]